MGSIAMSTFGNMIKDFEKKSEKAPYKSAIAVDKSVREGEDKYCDHSGFINISIWPDSAAGRSLQNLMKAGSMKKGTRLFVTGTWQGSRSSKEDRTFWELQVADFAFIPSGHADSNIKVTQTAKPNEQGGKAVAPAVSQTEQNLYNGFDTDFGGTAPAMEVYDEDIPF